MNVLFQQLYGMTSMTSMKAMDAKIEEQLQHSIPEDERRLLQKIYESSNLDEREALIAQRLGYLEVAHHLFARIEQRRSTCVS